jgi:valyl-tRNA synthetase
MNNIRDWCISRQIWWGHRIPVWYCDSCGKMIVSTQDPDACPDCGNASLRQEEDVLDTWFSSALWPFSTLGWPDSTPALKTFYPTSLLITGFDILFFWVARMMMMGKYIMHDVPFRDVYLHALVRDEKGEKMSKSKGNSINPLDMIDKYGTDAFRFTLAAFSAQGRDVRMSEERIEGYKFFVNKIWNAARFSLMNLEDYPAEGSVVATAEKSLKDQWILSRLQKTAGEVVRSLSEYRFNDAAAAVYAFFWHELCDWYLELAKPALYGRETPERRLAAQATLKEVLQDGLKLLHPFMPFVTEEIWQKLSHDGTSIMVSTFPEADEGKIDDEAERQMGLVMDVITSIRNIRGEMGISPSRKLRTVLSAPQDGEKALMTAAQGDIINLAALAELEIQGDMEEPRGVATGVVGSMRVFVHLEGLINIAEEKARLEKEMAKLDKDLAQVSRKLANRDFLAKAAEAVIRKEEEKHKALREKHVLLKAAYKKFQTMEER